MLHLLLPSFSNTVQNNFDLVHALENVATNTDASDWQVEYLYHVVKIPLE